MTPDLPTARGPLLTAGMDGGDLRAPKLGLFDCPAQGVLGGVGAIDPYDDLCHHRCCTAPRMATISG
jgi:hypothetical protein